MLNNQMVIIDVCMKNNENTCWKTTLFACKYGCFLLIFLYGNMMESLPKLRFFMLVDMIILQ